MAFTFGFYDSLNGDRKYNATQVSEIFDGLITDGVFATIGEMFMVDPGSSGLEVVVKTGRAWFNHTWNKNDSWMVLTLDTPDILLSRIDTVVIEVDASTAVRTNSIKIVKGAPATVPQKPPLLNEEFVHQYALAHVTVKPAAESIVNGDIENVVGTNKQTPFVTGILSTVPIDDLFDKWDGEFHTWFEHIKLELTEDVVSNLQRQLDEKVNVSDKATDEDVKAGTPGKWVDSSVLKGNKGVTGVNIGDFVFSSNDLQTMYPGKFLRCDFSEIDISAKGDAFDFLKGRPSRNTMPLTNPDDEISTYKSMSKSAQTCHGFLSDKGDYADVRYDGSKSSPYVAQVFVLKRSENYSTPHILKFSSASIRPTVTWHDNKWIVLDQSNGATNSFKYHVVDDENFEIIREGTFSIGGMSGHDGRSSPTYAYFWTQWYADRMYITVSRGDTLAIGYSDNFCQSIYTIPFETSEKISLNTTWCRSVFGTDRYARYTSTQPIFGICNDKIWIPLFISFGTKGVFQIYSCPLYGSSFTLSYEVKVEDEKWLTSDINDTYISAVHFSNGYAYFIFAENSDKTTNFCRIDLNSFSVDILPIRNYRMSDLQKMKILVSDTQAITIPVIGSDAQISHAVDNAMCIDLKKFEVAYDFAQVFENYIDRSSNEYTDALLLNDRFMIQVSYCYFSEYMKKFPSSYSLRSRNPTDSSQGFLVIFDLKYKTYMVSEIDVNDSYARQYITILSSTGLDNPNTVYTFAFLSDNTYVMYLFDFDRAVLERNATKYLKVED